MYSAHIINENQENFEILHLESNLSKINVLEINKTYGHLASK